MHSEYEYKNVVWINKIGEFYCSMSLGRELIMRVLDIWYNMNNIICKAV